jgi:hypothetical protein
MARRYYSSRTHPGILTIEQLHGKLISLYQLFRDKDYFKEKAGIIGAIVPEAIKHEASIALNFQLFPVEVWFAQDRTEDHIFDALEFLYDYISKPGPMVWMTSDTNLSYQDYGTYDEVAGRAEFRDRANVFLADYKSGYELTGVGIVLALGTDGLQHILDAQIVPYDEPNVDSKVRGAIVKWRNRHLSFDERKAAIRELADVFEWLVKAKNLSAVLDRKDESAIFDIANNFGIRHHDPKQKTNYDRAIWYPWIFHFYLATYHAAIRLLIRHEQQDKSSQP